MCITVYVHIVCSYIIDDRIIYVGYNPDSGYVSDVFDPKLGHVYTFFLDGKFIYADKVRFLIIIVVCIMLLLL